MTDLTTPTTRPLRRLTARTFALLCAATAVAAGFRVSAQTSAPDEAATLADFDPAAFLMPDGPEAQVMLLGTFHFDYPDLDEHVTAAEDRVDVRDAARREELAELIDYVARFRPTRIVIERQPGSTVNERYRRYVAGEDVELPTGEVYQVAFPLARRFGIDSLVYGDRDELSYELRSGKDSAVIRPWLEDVFDDTPAPGVDTALDARYFELYAHEEGLEAGASLLDIFRYMNSPQRVRLGHGHYLQFLNDRAPDALSLWWYARNLRIYREISKAAAPGERVLVLFGAGHLGILAQQLASDPRVEQVWLGEL